jgi:hypothetical protein
MNHRLKCCATSVLRFVWVEEPKLSKASLQVADHCVRAGVAK